MKLNPQLAGLPPGIYKMSNEDYHADRSAVSSSGLKHLLPDGSPTHFQSYLNAPHEETVALTFGAAYHSALLEPELFAKEYVVEPAKLDQAVDTLTDIKKLLKEAGLTQTGNKEELVARLKEFNPNVIVWSEYVERLTAGKKVLSVDSYATIHAMVASLRARSEVNLLLEDCVTEQSFFWVDEDTGVLCKCRADALSDLAILDAKSTIDASPGGFSKECAKYHYDLSAAFYTDGIKAVTGRGLPFVFLASEKEKPYASAVYQASDAFVENGRRKYKAALAKIAECRRANHWPGYQPTGLIDMIDLPRWAITA